VVINSAEIALKADEWYYRVYFHHSGYPGTATWTKAWEVHKKDPTMVGYFSAVSVFELSSDFKYYFHICQIVNRAVYGELGVNLKRRPAMARLHIYKDAKIPPLIKENITDQIRSIKDVPRRLDSYTSEEQEAFPKVFDYPQDFVLPVIKPMTYEERVQRRLEKLAKRPKV